MVEHRRHVEVLARAGLTFEHGVLSGGGSRSPHRPQRFADGLGVPVTIADAREAGALGSAIGAGLGVGLFADYEQEVASMTRPAATCEPNSAMTSHQDRRYRIYSALTEALRPFWAALETAGRG